jgi:hypothetical protein
VLPLHTAITIAEQDTALLFYKRFATFTKLNGVIWDDNINMDLQAVVCEGMDLIEMAQDRDSWRASCKCGNEPSGSIKYGEFLD